MVTALAASASPRALRTFTVGFAERELDESAGARSVAARYGTDHHEVRLSDSEAASLAPEAVRALDQPSADGVNTYVVSRAVARHGLKVVALGPGRRRAVRRLPHLPPARAARSAGRRSSAPSPRASRRRARRGGAGERAAEMTSRGASLAERYESLRAFWSQREWRRWASIPGIGSAPRTRGRRPRPPRASALLELGGYMRSTLLRDADAMSMAHSLELRVPFLDHELVRVLPAQPRRRPPSAGEATRAC